MISCFFFDKISDEVYDCTHACCHAKNDFHSVSFEWSASECIELCLISFNKAGWREASFIDLASGPRMFFILQVRIAWGTSSSWWMAATRREPCLLEERKPKKFRLVVWQKPYW